MFLLVFLFNFSALYFFYWGYPLAHCGSMTEIVGDGLELASGLGSSRDDLDDHFRRFQPIDLNLDLLGITHLDHESRVPGK